MNKPGNTQKEGFQNPFIAGPSVVRNDFIGRKDIIDKIVFFLKDKRDINFLIYGQRRIGKTSLLNKIQEIAGSLRLAQPVYFNFQDKGRIPLPQLLFEIGKEINRDLDLKLDVNERDFSPSNAFQYFKKHFVPSIMTKIDREQVLLLIFDEFDVLAAGENTDTGSIDYNHTPASKSFIPFLENLAEEIRDNQYALKFIFAIGSNYKNVELKRLNKLERFGPHAEISYFTREETRALLTSLTVHSIPFKKEAVDLIYHLTSGHPYFTQCLARVSFDSAERKGKKYITLNIVKQELMTATRIFSSSVSRIWDSFHAVDQVILYIIATIKEENRPATTEAIREKAIAFKVVPAVESLSQTLARLKDIKAIKENKDPEVSYDFYVEFIRKWIGTKSPGQLLSYHGFLGL